MEEIINTEIKLHQTFKSLDCISFDMDMAIVRYNNNNIGELVYGCMLDHLVNIFPFLKNSKPDFEFSKRGLVIDLELGLILKLDNKKQVIKAYRGNKIVSKEEIDSIYHNQSIPNGSPLKDYTGDNCSRFFTMISYFETPVTGIFRDFMAHLQNTDQSPIDINNKEETTKLLKQLAKEILIAINKHYSDFYTGSYFSEFTKDPSKFIYKASEQFKQWLQLIRSKGTKVLLITNSKSEYCYEVMKYSFGLNFKDYFDCIIVDAKKPEFFRANATEKLFTRQLTFKPKDKSEYLPCDNIELNSEDSIFRGGNIHLVLEKLKQSFGKENISFCYVGDNIIGDVVAPKKVKLMTVAIIEEIQDSNEIIILKRQKNTKNQEVKVDKEGLVERSTGTNSYEWGSFFHIHDDHTNLSIDTFWSGILRDNADIVVYGVDTLAQYYHQDKFENKDTLHPCAVVYGGY